MPHRPSPTAIKPLAAKQTHPPLPPRVRPTPAPPHAARGCGACGVVCVCGVWCVCVACGGVSAGLLGLLRATPQETHTKARHARPTHTTYRHTPPRTQNLSPALPPAPSCPHVSHTNKTHTPPQHTALHTDTATAPALPPLPPFPFPSRPRRGAGRGERERACGADARAGHDARGGRRARGTCPPPQHAQLAPANTPLPHQPPLPSATHVLRVHVGARRHQRRHRLRVAIARGLVQGGVLLRRGAGGQGRRGGGAGAIVRTGWGGVGGGKDWAGRS